jgi:hypothetical protein
MKFIKAISFIFIGLGIVLLFVKQPGDVIFVVLGSLILVITYLLSATKHLFQRNFYAGIGELVAVFTLITFVLGILYWPEYRFYFLICVILFLVMLIVVGTVKKKFDIRDINTFSIILSIITILNFTPYHLFTEYTQVKYMPDDLNGDEICDRLNRYVTEINKIEKNELILKYIDLYSEHCKFSNLPSNNLPTSNRNYDIKVLDGDFELTKTTKIRASVDPINIEFEQLHIIPGNKRTFEQIDEYTKVIPYSGDSVIVQLVIEDKNNNEWYLIASKIYRIKTGANNGEHAGPL